MCFTVPLRAFCCALAQEVYTAEVLQSAFFQSLCAHNKAWTLQRLQTTCVHNQKAFKDFQNYYTANVLYHEESWFTLHFLFTQIVFAQQSLSTTKANTSVFTHIYTMQPAHRTALA